MAPRQVPDAWAPDLDPPGARRAAVLLLFYPSPRGPVLPLTLRHSALARHAGQVSLPGGAIDPGETAVSAALREAQEELGVITDQVQVVGALSPLWVDISNFVVHPVVGLADHPPAFTLDPREVEALVETPVVDLCDPARVQWSRRARGGLVVDYPYFDLGGHHVWGATAMILGELAALIDGARPAR